MVELIPALSTAEPIRPSAPDCLGVAGAALWGAVLSDLDPGLEMDARELDTLQSVCELEDTIDSLAESIDRDGATYAVKGIPKLNPAVPELRQARLAKMRLLAALATSDQSMKSPTSRRGAHAANVRWDRERKRRERAAS